MITALYRCCFVTLGTSSDIPVSWRWSGLQTSLPFFLTRSLIRVSRLVLLGLQTLARAAYTGMDASM